LTMPSHASVMDQEVLMKKRRDKNHRSEDVVSRPRFGLLLAGSCRFSYTDVAEGSAGQAPGGKE
jgi:hypothetical protein